MQKKPKGTLSSLRVLLVEDNPGDARLIREYLRESADQPVELDHVETLAEALKRIASSRPDAVLLDLGLPDSEGLGTVNRLREVAPAVPVIVLTGLDNSEVSLGALKEGAQDYLCKSEVQGNLLPSILRHAIERQHLINALTEQAQRLMDTNWALIESEKRFETFLKASPDSICIKDVEGRYLLANPEFEKRMRLEGTDWLGGTARDIYAPEWADMVAAHDRSVLEAGVGQVFEVDIHPILGLELVERVVKFPLRSASGEIIGLGSIAADITDRKRTEVALANSLRSLKVLSSCNEILVRAKSEEWLLRKICQTIGEVGGYPLVWVGFVEHPKRRNIKPAASFGDHESALNGMHLSCVGDTENLCPAGAAIRRAEPVMAVSGYNAATCLPITQLAERRGFRSCVALPLIGSRSVFGVLSIHSFEPGGFTEEEVNLLTELANDLSYGVHALRMDERRKDSEAELRKLRRAVEQSPNIVIVTDRSGIIEFVNPKFSEVTGYDVEEAIGKNPRFLGSGEMADSEYAAMWTTIVSGDEWRGVFHNKCKDGSYYWAETAISPVRDRDGEITHFIGIQEDISQRIMTEQRLRQSEKMEALGSLAGGIAHDFNNMLLPILTLSKMVMREFPEDGKQYGRLKNVVEAAERASDLVKRILAFSRTAEAEKKDADLGEIVHNSIELLRATLPATIDLRTRIASNVGSAKVDQAQLQTIVLNLASNAADALGGSTGRLEISLERKLIPQQQGPDGMDIPAGAYAELLVVDNGPGIPEDVLPHVFEPFFTTKDVGEGTGLGLAMVHGIVTEHGGSVSIESEIGRGTRIVVLLPLETNATASSS